MPKEKQSLQDALKRLEEIVKELEGKDVDVGVGMEKYREGVELVKFCQKELGEAENEFKKLKKELEEESETEV